MENIFHRGLDGTMILYTILVLSQKTEIKQTIRILASRKWKSDFCIVHFNGIYTHSSCTKLGKDNKNNIFSSSNYNHTSFPLNWTTHMQ
jgi:isopentenyl phosphate kinase